MKEDEEIAALDREINSYFDDSQEIRAQRSRRLHSPKTSESSRAAQHRLRFGPGREKFLRKKREWMRDYRKRHKEEKLHVK